MADNVRNGIRSFLQINPAQQNVFQVTEQLDYYGNAAVNRIWVRGDANELKELYSSLPGDVNRIRFWAAVPSAGNDINKLHTGLPGLVRRILTDIVISDMGDIDAGDKWQREWSMIEQDNHFRSLVEEAVKEILTVGDGAFKVSFDPTLTELPIIEFVPGDRLEYVTERGRLKEVVFRTEYCKKNGTYTLEERYGRGYIHSRLLKNDQEVQLTVIPETQGMQPTISFQGNFCMAVRFMAFKSDKYNGRFFYCNEAIFTLY